MAQAQKWAADIAGPAYAIDDQSAIKVADGVVEVVSEGNWKQFTPTAKKRAAASKRRPSRRAAAT